MKFVFPKGYGWFEKGKKKIKAMFADPHMMCLPASRMLRGESFDRFSSINARTPSGSTLACCLLPDAQPIIGMGSDDLIRRRKGG
jgi:hypothetical protein